MKRLIRSGGTSRLRTESLRRLAWFRYRVRCFLRFSEQAARTFGITPQQHQLLLGVAGYTGRGWATITELAEFMQARHNAVVGLVQRAAKRGLVRKTQSAHDRRFVKVRLTRRAYAILLRISRMNLRELEALQFEIMKPSSSRPRAIPAAEGSE